MMIVHPDIQRRAQAEIDKQVGEDRIPDMTDHGSLPYVACIVKELLRYNPPIPLVPHATIEDDVYNGYVIPKGRSINIDSFTMSDAQLDISGAWVMANLWCCSLSSV